MPAVFSMLPTRRCDAESGLHRLGDAPTHQRFGIGPALRAPGIVRALPFLEIKLVWAFGPFGSGGRRAQPRSCGQNGRHSIPVHVPDSLVLEDRRNNIVPQLMVIVNNKYNLNTAILVRRRRCLLIASARPAGTRGTHGVLLFSWQCCRIGSRRKRRLDLRHVGIRSAGSPDVSRRRECLGGHFIFPVGKGHSHDVLFQQIN